MCAAQGNSKGISPAHVHGRKRGLPVFAKPATRAKFETFGQMLLVGLGVTLFALPLVTLLPAVAAGARHLENEVAGRADQSNGFFKLTWQAIRGGWLYGAVTTTVLLLLACNIVFAAQNVVPGGRVLIFASGASGVAVLLLVCRAASIWLPEEPWQALFRKARILTFDDPVGTGYILAGVLGTATVVWMFPPLVVIAPGILVISLVACERQRLAQTVGP